MACMCSNDAWMGPSRSHVCPCLPILSGTLSGEACDEIQIGQGLFHTAEPVSQGPVSKLDLPDANVVFLATHSRRPSSPSGAGPYSTTCRGVRPSVLAAHEISAHFSHFNGQPTNVRPDGTAWRLPERHTNPPRLPENMSEDMREALNHGGGGCCPTVTKHCLSVKPVDEKASTRDTSGAHGTLKTQKQKQQQ